MVIASFAAFSILGVGLLPQPAGAREPRARAGEVLVMVRDPNALEIVDEGRLSSRDVRVRDALDRHGLSHGAALHSPRGAARGAVMRLVSQRPNFDAFAAARELAATGRFRAVAPNLVLDLYTTPSDPNLFLQWHMSTTTTADPQLYEAWNLGQGDTSTVIAIIDNGFDTGHQDLAANLWINRNEIPGNGVDDDDNGYVDDVKGWDFGDHDNNPIAEPMPDSSGLDVGFHGSSVAGVAAAVTNNAVGIAGAGWKCRFMALKCGDAEANITLSAVSEAFGYVVDQGAAVLNLSIGTADTTARAFFQALVDDANAADIVVVSAAGNSGVETRTFPASCDGVLAVAATTESNTRASFSNWGPWVDIAAPGELIWTSISSNYTFDFLTQLVLILSGWDGETPYVYEDGTSFASPLVAGICGLVRTRFPDLPAPLVIDHVIQTGDVVTYDHPIGPRVNAFRALSEPVLGIGPLPAPRMALEAAYPNPFAHRTNLSFTLGQSGPVRLRLYDTGGRLVRELVRAWLPAGRHSALWDGLAGTGRPALSGIYFAALETPQGRTVRKLILAR